MLVDSHCHLNFPQFADDLDGVIARARANDVRVMQTICTNMAEFEAVYAIAERFEGVYASVGVHPNGADKDEIVSVAQLIEACSREFTIGIGETGLDYHYPNTDREAQIHSFMNHIEAARQTGLPLIIHARDADGDMAEILTREMARGAFKALLHCFSSGAQLAATAIELGVYISFSGIITFKSATALHDIVKTVPMERILIETDSPYLAPVPYRGKTNEPGFVSYTNRILAELRNLDEAETARNTSENFFRLFDKAHYPA